jgi:ubiquitin C-terminal hydrolase
LNPKKVEDVINDTRHYPLSYTIHRLFLHLYPTQMKEKEIYKPEAIWQVLGQINFVYKSINRRDPNELLSFILNTLHNELNTLKNIKVDDGINYLNIYNKNSVIQYGIEKYVKTNYSSISKAFDWFEIKQSKCSYCNTESYNFNSFNIFELDILGCSKYKKNQNITLYDCLDYHSLQRNNNLYCNNCKNYTKIFNSSKIYSSPNLFAFLLDRKNLDNNYLKIMFYVQDKIDIQNFVENKQAPKQYQLIGIISFNIQEKKYVSFCMSPINKQWYCYNDENIYNVQNDMILKLNNNNQYIPCILLYQSVLNNFH